VARGIRAISHEDAISLEQVGQPTGLAGAT